VRILDLILGPALGQCCGGRVELWLERLTREDLPWLRDATQRLRARDSVALATEVSGATVHHRLLKSTPGTPGVQLRRSPAGRITLLEELYSPRPPLWIFGAGHVGQALVRVLAELALFDITWIDSRAELFPTGIAECVTTHACDAPEHSIADAPTGARYVVLTHDHALDYELCRRILLRGDASGVGLIGSASKSARFRSRLLRDGISREALAGLTCPIGITGITSKLPAAIAIAIAAQLLQQQGRQQGAAAEPRAVPASVTGCVGNCESCGAQHRQEA
jgi:xanthine dehydrogenase accessory factor